MDNCNLQKVFRLVVTTIIRSRRTYLGYKWLNEELKERERGRRSIENAASGFINPSRGNSCGSKEKRKPPAAGKAMILLLAFFSDLH